VVYLAPQEGHCQRAWPVLQYPSVALLKWVREDPNPWSEPSALYRHLPTTRTLVTYHLALYTSMTHKES